MKRYLRKIKRILVPPQTLLEKEKRSLKDLPTQPIFLETLSAIGVLDLQAVFKEHITYWEENSHEIYALMPPEDAFAGVNPGDRRAIHALITHLRPANILEVGTYIGASTLHIAHAQKQLQKEAPEKTYHLTTVDILEVNALDGPWHKEGMAYSPQAMIKALGVEDRVSFIAQDSLQFMRKTTQRFDFIFLDGNHRANAVYQEVIAALNILNPQGYILLHDYFPSLEPLWSNGPIIPGPCLACQRLQQENPLLTVLPLGELPWPTKLASNITSLALLGRST